MGPSVPTSVKRSLVTDVEVPEYQSRENYDKEVMTWQGQAMQCHGDRLKWENHLPQAVVLKLEKNLFDQKARTKS